MRYHIGAMAHPHSLKNRARTLRADGWTHREIASKLRISVSTAHLWCEGIELSQTQQQAIFKRRNVHLMSEKERAVVVARLATYRRIYSAEELLQRIRDFHGRTGRMPLKREFNAWGSYARLFGSWNKAIRLAGLEPNPELFARKFVAKDGHLCDSFTEKVIDDWLSERHIAHQRTVRYGTTKYTADFKLEPNIIVEFFGLAGVQKAYDSNIQTKRRLAAELGYRLIEIYPADIYPTNRLAELFDV